MRFSLVFFILFFTGCYGQKFQYKDVPEKPSFIEHFDRSKERLSLLERCKDVYDITNSLPKNYVMNGTVDYTNFLQKAIDEHRVVLLPNFPVLVNDKGLEILDNSVIIFNDQSKLLLQASGKTNYEILRIHNKNNILVFSPNIVGDRYVHTSTKGEWGMGISIKSSSNITILNSNISNCWGDGLYLGQIKDKVNNNIVINHGVIDNNRRNGISVISGENLVLKNLVISNTNGTSPEAGLDFEPNFNNEVLSNIKVENIYTFNNRIQGIVFYLGRLRGEDVKNVNIELKNHLNEFSNAAIAYSSTKIKNRELGELLKGNIVLENIESKNTKYPFFLYKETLHEKVNVIQRKLNQDEVIYPKKTNDE